MRTPYNNGKIKMGINYQPPKYVEEDSDMLAIQGWLIGDNRRARITYWANVAYVVLLSTGLVLAVLFS